MDPAERDAVLDLAIKRLSPVERWVMVERYRPGDMIPTPYRVLTAACGLPRRRIIQIERAAMDKLDSALEEATPPPRGRPGTRS